MSTLTPREMIAHNAPGAVGITNTVLWVRLTHHVNPYIADPQPVGILKILEVGVDGQIIKAVFSENGTGAFVDMADPGWRVTTFTYARAAVPEGPRSTSRQELRRIAFDNGWIQQSVGGRHDDHFRRGDDYLRIGWSGPDGTGRFYDAVRGHEKLGTEIAQLTLAEAVEWLQRPEEAQR